MTTVKNIYDYINSIAPFDTQEEWDNSGHLVGDFRAEVKRVVLSLDATKEAVSYCADVNADLLLTHHPVIFQNSPMLNRAALFMNSLKIISPVSVLTLILIKQNAG